MKKVGMILIVFLLLFAACGEKEAENEVYMGESPELAPDSMQDIAYIGEAEIDPSMPPIVQISYESGEIAGAMTPDTYGYSWSWEEDGQVKNKVVDAVHPLDDPDIKSIRLSDTDGTVKLRNDPRMTEVRVSVWEKGADYDDVNILFPTDGVIELSEEASVYLIEVEYGETGNVGYAFLAE